MKLSLTFVLVLSLIACCIEIDISAPSFPDISDYFNISDGLTQMTIAANFLGFCIASLLYGPLSDCYGRRKVMVIGNLIMFIGAIGCTASFSIEILLFSRLIQGIGASTSAVVVFAMVADVYKGRAAAKIIGDMNSLLTIFMSVAPIAGALLNKTVGWRGNYAVVAVVCFLTWLCIYFQLPETNREFTKLEPRRIIRDYIKLLKDWRFLYTAIIPSVFFSGYMIFIACAPFLYMETYHLNIFHYSIHLGVVIAAFSIVSLYVGKIHNFIGSFKKNIIYSVILNILASIAMLNVALFFSKNAYLATMSMVLFSISSAIGYPIIFTKSLEIFPEIKGIASSLVMSLRSFMCFSAIGLNSYLYDGSLIKVSIALLLCSTLIIIFTYKMLYLISFAEET